MTKNTAQPKGRGQPARYGQAMRRTQVFLTEAQRTRAREIGGNVSRGAQIAIDTYKETKMKYSDLATKYNTTIRRIREEQVSFLENEGFMPDGREANDLLEWLDMVFAFRNPLDNQEPFQKGDRGYGLQ